MRYSSKNLPDYWLLIPIRGMGLAMQAWMRGQ
jgi:hypothetical protein